MDEAGAPLTERPGSPLLLHLINSISHLSNLLIPCDEIIEITQDIIFETVSGNQFPVAFFLYFYFYF